MITNCTNHGPCLTAHNLGIRKQNVVRVSFVIIAHLLTEFISYHVRFCLVKKS